MVEPWKYVIEHAGPHEAMIHLAMENGIVSLSITGPREEVIHLGIEKDASTLSLVERRALQNVNLLNLPDLDNVLHLRQAGSWSEDCTPRPT